VGATAFWDTAEVRDVVHTTDTCQDEGLTIGRAHDTTCSSRWKLQRFDGSAGRDAPTCSGRRALAPS